MAVLELRRAPAEKLRVLLVAPLPTQDTSGIANWTRIVLREAARRPEVELLCVDTAVRYRASTDLSLPSRLLGGSVQAVRDTLRARRRLRSDRPAVLHLCTSASLSTLKDWAIARLARRYRVPSVVHYRLGRLPRIVARGGIEWQLIRKTVALSRAVLTLDAKSEACVRGAMPQANVLRLPNLVDLDAIDAAAREVPPRAEEDGRTRLVYAGHVIPAKGLRELVAACARLPSSGVTLDVIGPGNREFLSQLRQIASARGSADWLRFHGQRDHDAVIRHIAGADVLVLPSHSEGMPNVVLEGMACGRPVLATAVGAVPEMLGCDGPGPAGVCVPPQDAEALRAAVLQLASDPQWRRDLGRAGRRRAERVYAAPVAFAQLVSLWESLAAPP